jgi:hypothetical protein
MFDELSLTGMWACYMSVCCYLLMLQGYLVQGLLSPTSTRKP